MRAFNSAIFSRVSGLLAAGMMLAGCGAGEGREAEEVPPGITLQGVRFHAYRGATLAATGEAATASFRRDSTDLTAERLVVRVPARPGEPDDVVEAPRASGNLRAGAAHLQGGVTAVVRGGGTR